MQKVLKFSRQKERNLENWMGGGGYRSDSVDIALNLVSNFHVQLMFCLNLFLVHPQSQTCVHIWRVFLLHFGLFQLMAKVQLTWLKL